MATKIVLQRDRAPEGFGFERGNFQRLFQRDSGQLNLDGRGSVIGVEQYVDAGQLSDGAIDGVGLVGES